MIVLAKKWSKLALLCCLCSPAYAQHLELYTPYAEVSVPPGQSITYPVDVINKDSAERTAALEVEGLPRDWKVDLKSGGWTVDKISVLPADKKNLTLSLDVPLNVNKGTYHFLLAARGLARLPLSVVVSRQGTARGAFSVDQPNMAGGAKSTFTFNAKLQNATDQDQVYALDAQAPPGWTVAYKANYKQVSSVSIPADHTQDITIDVNPPESATAGTYNIPVAASNGITTVNLALGVDITGSYNLQLTTPTGVLSTTVTAGDTRRVELIAHNTGSSPLKNISFQFNAPPNWDVTFEPTKLDDLLPGASAQVFAVIKPDQNAITGDYQATLTARTAEVSSNAAFRVTVATSLVWGWLGLAIIVAALGVIYFLFRKYGRR